MKNHQRHHRTGAGFSTLSGFVIGLALIGLYEVPEARADDDKVFAPQFCVPTDGNGSRVDTDQEVFPGYVENAGGSLVQYICPLVRDNLGSDLDRVFVRLFNAALTSNPAMETTECCIYTFSALGTQTDVECGHPTVNADEQSIGINGPNAVDNGHYVLACDLDAGDRLFGYRLDEP